MRKTYSGIYKVENPSKYKGDATNVVFRSGWEKLVFKWCDGSGDVLEWSSEEIVIPYFLETDKKYHRYFPDVYIKHRNGKTYLIEIKPAKETKPPTSKRKTKRYIEEGYTYVKNRNKWDAAENFCKDNGWHFQIWTEHTLQSMGLMPKKPKPLKRMKPLPRPKKRKKTPK